MANIYFFLSESYKVCCSLVCSECWWQV